MELREDLQREEYLEFLDNIRESGVTNMFGASQYLEECYELNRQDAKDVLIFWMETFGDRHAA